MKMISMEIAQIKLLKSVSVLDPLYRMVHYSIQEFGVMAPVTVSKNRFLLDGHKVCKALEEEG